MLGYVCKYTPMELFEAMDTEITRLEPSVTDFNHADTLMHANRAHGLHAPKTMKPLHQDWPCKPCKGCKPQFLPLPS